MKLGNVDTEDDLVVIHLRTVSHGDHIACATTAVDRSCRFFCVGAGKTDKARAKSAVEAKVAEIWGLRTYDDGCCVQLTL